MDLYSPISDRGSQLLLDLIDIAMNCGLFLIGMSPALAVFAFYVTR